MNLRSQGRWWTRRQERLRQNCFEQIPPFDQGGSAADRLFFFFLAAVAKRETAFYLVVLASKTVLRALCTSPFVVANNKNSQLAHLRRVKGAAERNSRVGGLRGEMLRDRKRGSLGSILVSVVVFGSRIKPLWVFYLFQMNVLA